jgi:shikimate dehydrogenase
VRALYLILGNPVAHSRSPRLHARAFQLLGVDAVYAPAQVSDLAIAFAGMKALGVAGCNVTVPYKQDVLPLCSSVSDEARKIGAVNCVDREFRGHNTDVAGLRRSVPSLPSPAVVLGAGGAARAAIFALPGCRILNRTPAKAAALGEVATVEDLRSAALVVNCTTVGLHDDSLPVDLSLLRKDAVVVDLVYRGPTGETALVQRARSQGHAVVDGVSILVHQAIASLEIWLGRNDLYDLYKPLREAALA